jgi:hypothetical protein
MGSADDPLKTKLPFQAYVLQLTGVNYTSEPKTLGLLFPSSCVMEPYVDV